MLQTCELCMMKEGGGVNLSDFVLSIYLSVCWCMYPSFYVSVSLPIDISVCLYVYLAI